MEVGDTVTSCEAAKHISVVDRIRSGNIHNLEAHFECSTSLVSSDLQPHLTGWYDSFMPGKSASPVCKST